MVLVVKDGGQWLPQCLQGLSRQTYPRIGVIAIDNGSTDNSVELLEGALGAARVIPLNRNLGFPGAVAAALRSDVAEQADYVLLMHDDTILAGNAVANLVSAAERIEDVGVVGPKVLDWEEPQVLREIGHSTDRFGYPYSPLDEGEIDQGQYERIRDVLFVSSCAMLVSRKLWSRIGPPDERLAGSHEDLDYCWRARVAGFKVLMTPLAVAHHREATARGERPGGPPEVRVRYERERAALASMLKNYSLLSLLWVLPLYLVLGLARVGVLIVSRKFEDALQLLSAWRWNFVRLPGTLLRRRRTQKVRAVRDGVVRRSMAPAGIRLRRWVLAATSALLPQTVETEGPSVSIPGKVLRYVGTHPVATAWGVGLVIAVVAYRNLLGASPLVGGALGVPPSSPFAYFRELAAALRHTGLGGNYAASPALAVLGAGSTVAFGSPALLQKILLLALPAFAAVGCYRAIRFASRDAFAATVGAFCYGLSSVMLSAVSNGEIGGLVFLAGVPWLVTKLELPFHWDFHLKTTRWIAGAGIGVAVLAAFFPGTALAAALLVVAYVAVPVKGTRRGRGVALAAAGLALGAALIFPVTIDLVRTGGQGLGQDGTGETFSALARLALRPGPGLWRTGFYLPIAAAFGLALVTGTRRAEALRSAVIAVVGLYLAWLSAGGYLPRSVSNTVAYVGLVAFEYVLLVGLAVAELRREEESVSVRSRRIAVGVLAALIGVGIIGQGVQVLRGRWTVGGPERIPAAYPIVSDPVASKYRILWLGRSARESFLPPGGSADGTVAAGPDSVRFAVRSSTGASSLDIGRAPVGPGYDYVRQAIAQIAEGVTRHGGALLAPLSIRYIVAQDGDLPERFLHRLTRQADLDVVPAGGLIILRNSKVVPIDAVIANDQWRRAAFSTDLADIAVLPAVQTSDVTRAGQVSVPGSVSLALIGEQFDRRWLFSPTAGGRPVAGRLAFQWAVGYEGQIGPRFGVRFEGGGERRIEMVALGLLWLVMLWFVRKPPRA